MNGLDSAGRRIWLGRLAAIVKREFGIRLDEPYWDLRLFWCLACERIPGFSIKGPDENRHGRPNKWDKQRQLELLGDVEQIRENNKKLSRTQICRSLPHKPGYCERWGKFTPASLCKAYSQARKQRVWLIFEAGLSDPMGRTFPEGIDSVESALKRFALKH
jgi:hypothetical protein